MRSSPLWGVKRCWSVVTGVSGQPTGPIFKGQTKNPWSARPLKMGLIVCTETSVTNYQSTMSNISEGRRSKFWSSAGTLKLVLRHSKCGNSGSHGCVMSDWQLPTFRSIVMPSSSGSSIPTRIIRAITDPKHESSMIPRKYGCYLSIRRQIQGPNL